jgi:hypothetical protein
MSNILDLKQIEIKAYRSTYQDGLWDINMGVIVLGMAVFLHRPESGYSSANFLWLLMAFVIGQIIFQTGKRYITLPRMGQARFGPIRQQKKKTLAIILGIVVLIQVSVVVVTAMGSWYPVIGTRLFGDVSIEHIAVAALASLFVGPPMLFISYMNDFLRGYYIAVMMAQAVFLMIYVDQFVYPLIIGGLIIVPGLVLFIRFIRKYPVPQGDESNG